MSIQPARATAHVDYLTLSSIPSRGIKRRETRKLVSLADDFLAAERARGNDLRQWSLGNFKGFSAGSIQAGADEDGVVIRLSGHMADKHWREVLPYATNVSRIDLAVTVEMNDAELNLVALHREQLLRWRRRHMPRLQVGVIDRGDRGCTLAIGSRTSDIYQRIYDKHAESKGSYPRGTWRYENELKRKPALIMARHLASVPVPEVEIRGSVSKRFAARGIRLELPDAESSCPAAPAMTSDDQRRLDWLRVSCSRSVEKLINAGKLNEVITALGLDSYVELLANKQTAA